MLQRIQSLYLLLALILTSLLFSMDLAQLANETGLFRLTFSGLYAIDAENKLIVSTYYISALLIISDLLLFIAIFLFSKRILQIRICGMLLALLAGLSGIIYYIGKTASKELGAELHFSWALVFPLIALIFVYLAIRAIGKDEALIRSIDRIR